MKHTGQAVPNGDGTYKKGVCLNCYMPEEPYPYTYQDYSCSRHCQKVEEEHDSCEKKGFNVEAFMTAAKELNKSREERLERDKLTNPRSWIYDQTSYALGNRYTDHEWNEKEKEYIIEYLDQVIPDLQRQIDEVKKEARDAMRNAINN